MGKERKNLHDNQSSKVTLEWTFAWLNEYLASIERRVIDYKWKLFAFSFRKWTNVPFKMVAMDNRTWNWYYGKTTIDKDSVPSKLYWVKIAFIVENRSPEKEEKIINQFNPLITELSL